MCLGIMIGVSVGSAIDALRKKKSQEHEDDAVSGGGIGPLFIPLPQGFAQQGIYAHAHAGGEADEQILHGECQGEGRHGALGNSGHVNAVHHVIQGLHQHGDDQGQCHGQKQPAKRHGPHFVLLLQRRLGLFRHISAFFL